MNKHKLNALYAEYPQEEYFFFPNTKLSDWITKVYELSCPQDSPRIISNELLKETIEEFNNYSITWECEDLLEHELYDIDYLEGISCKSGVINFLNFNLLALDKNNWEDHTKDQLNDLIKFLKE